MGDFHIKYFKIDVFEKDGKCHFKLTHIPTGVYIQKEEQMNKSLNVMKEEMLAEIISILISKVREDKNES